MPCSAPDDSEGQLSIGQQQLRDLLRLPDPIHTNLMLSVKLMQLPPLSLPSVADSSLWQAAFQPPGFWLGALHTCRTAPLLPNIQRGLATCLTPWLSGQPQERGSCTSVVWEGLPTSPHSTLSSQELVETPQRTRWPQGVSPVWCPLLTSSDVKGSIPGAALRLSGTRAVAVLPLRSLYG